MTISYTTDLSGVNPANLVDKEVHTTSESQYRDYRFIVPNFSPFYVDNFKLRLTGANGRELVEDVDFQFALPYVTGTRVTGKQMYGGFTLINLDLNGVLSVDYQTVGGDEICDRLYVLTQLADKAYNPRTTIWDVVSNAPNAFPPTPHYQDYSSFFGQEQLVAALAEVRDAILTNSSLTAENIRDFLARYSNEKGGYVRREGDTMTGPLGLPANPTEPEHAATKAYVDQRVADQTPLWQILSEYVKDEEVHRLMQLKLNLTGGILTGPLSLHADPLNDDQAVTKRYVDALFQQLNDRLLQLEDKVENMKNSGYITREQVLDMINETNVRFGAHK